MKKVYFCSLALALMAGSAFGVNSVTVNGDAAIDGAFGMEVLIDGSNNVADVRNICPTSAGDPPGPTDEAVYRASFKVNMNGLAMDEGVLHHIATVRAHNGCPAGLSNRNEIRVFVRFRGADVNPYKIRIQCRNDNLSWTFVGGHSLPSLNNRTVGLEWQAASAPGADDGVCRMFINNILRAETTTLDNDERAIGQFRLGVDRIDTNTSGSMYYDTFESFRTLAP